MKKEDLITSTSLGIQFALTLCLFTGIGYWFDKKFGTSPLFLILLGFVGFGAGMYYVIRSARVKVKKNGSAGNSGPSRR